MSQTKVILGEEYPDYISAAIPYFLLFVVVEAVLGRLLKGKDDFQLKDSLSSLSTGLSTIVLETLIPVALVKTLEFVAVIYIYKHWRFMDVDENSTVASIICFLGVDLGYYWFHRAAHEINLLWSSHVTHHSSEFYNLTTALRQNIFQPYVSWVFYLPLGFFMPPKIFFFHKQFNTIYQFWVHTKYIGKLGPLEWIINTPSHHRVHHGRNPRYLDKNYAGTLIIWDRIFGTFQVEDEEPFYGIVTPLNSSDPTWSQIHHLVYVWKGLEAYKTWGDKLKMICYGPGWKPGLPRLGDTQLVPVPKKSDQEARLGPSLPFLINLYIFLHFLVVSGTSLVCLALYEHQLGYYMTTLLMVYLYLSLTTFGSLFDKKKYSIYLELARLVAFVGFTFNYSILFIQVVRIFYSLSFLFLLVTFHPFSKQIKHFVKIE